MLELVLDILSAVCDGVCFAGRRDNSHSIFYPITVVLAALGAVLFVLWLVFR